MNRFKLLLLGLRFSPLIAWVRPKVIDFGPERVSVRIKPSMGNRNHLGSMYFGVICIGADLTAGLWLVKKFSDLKREKRAKSIKFAFKSFKADFLARSHEATLFVSESCVQVERLLEEALRTGERVEEWIPIIATEEKSQRVVARCELLLSVKADAYTALATVSGNQKANEKLGL